jgi:hypothetical protein
MPPVTLHCMVHLTPKVIQASRFPAIHTILYSDASSPEHYTLSDMMLWATIPYFVWQLSYHFFITVRRRAQIAAGRPTSFTYLRKSYANVWIVKALNSLPEPLVEPGFMMIQYTYALTTMVPCPLWFRYRWASSSFLLAIFSWSVYNGATYYIDIFGTRFQKELEQLKKDVAKWQKDPFAAGSPLMVGMTPDTLITPLPRLDGSGEEVNVMDLGARMPGTAGLDTKKEGLSSAVEGLGQTQGKTVGDLLRERKSS